MKFSQTLSLCSDPCVTYQQKASYPFPTLTVHEPLPVSGPEALKTILASMRGGGKTVTVLEKALNPEVIKVGPITARLVLLEIGKGSEYGSPTYRLLMLMEQGGVTLPLEQDGPRKAVLEAYSDDVKTLASSVKLDPVAIKKDLTARTLAFTKGVQEATQALKNGYARGEKVKLYAWSESGVKNVYTTSGLQLRAYNNTGTLAFLPGGIVLEDGGDFQSPTWSPGGGLPARWKKVGGGYQVTTPDGQTTTYAVEKASNNQTRIEQGRETYLEIPPLTKEDLIGIFSTQYSASSGLGDTAVNSSGNLDVKLLPSGRYEDSSESFTAVTSPNVTIGTGNNKKSKGGKWTFDSASYTLTLYPDGGGSQSGLTYTEAFSPSARQIKSGGSVDWLFMGREGWWKSK